VTISRSPGSPATPVFGRLTVSAGRNVALGDTTAAGATAFAHDLTVGGVAMTLTSDVSVGANKIALNATGAITSRRA